MATSVNGAHAVLRGEGLGALRLGVADGDELRLGQIAQGRGVDLADLAAADQPVRRSSCAPGSTCALMRRRKASDSAISSMPFMPSSMLTQPR